ncbi:MAG: hypothetical protein H5U40_06600, partial [Polyangiaceae bacterium]|nr:hypothetical protein [Polyangiaceae bacterium]
MIVATGPTHAGEGAWVDVLRAAGVPILGEAIPSGWSDNAKAEVRPTFFAALREQGIYYKTNPDPFSQAYLDAPEAGLFALGMKTTAVLRTERAYLGHVIAAMPHFRSLGGAVDAEAVLIWWNDYFL